MEFRLGDFDFAMLRPAVLFLALCQFLPFGVCWAGLDKRSSLSASSGLYLSKFCNKASYLFGSFPEIDSV